MTINPTLIAAALTFGLSCASAPGVPVALPAGTTPTGTLFPPAQAALILPELASEEGAEHRRPSLWSLVEEYGQVTNQQVLLTEQVRLRLESTHCALKGGAVLPVHAVQSMTEHMLSANGFYFKILRSAEPFMIEVWSSNDQVDLGVASTMSPEAVLADADHPALIVSTVYPLQSVGARQLGNALRAVHSPTLLRLVALGDNTIYLVGPMPTVAAWLRTLRDIDQAEAANVEPADGEETGEETEGEAAPVKLALASFVLTHATADEAGRQVQRLFDRAAGVDIAVIADSRTNALVVYCAVELMGAVKETVALLDIDT
jgi:type II secretory pathway component GspD/PulD (secretin)